MSDNARFRFVPRCSRRSALAGCRAFAQRGQDAGLVGTVRDGSGAAVAGATLSASSPQLIGGAQKAVSDAHGAYRFPFLPPGDYDVVAAQTGFKTVRRSGVTLRPLPSPSTSAWKWHR